MMIKVNAEYKRKDGSMRGHTSDAHRPKPNLSTTCLVVVVVLIQIKRHTLFYNKDILATRMWEMV
jgi:hypothetical protein